MDNNQSLRLQLYALIAILALGMIAGRIAHVTSKNGHTPFLSANDRSRWSTIRSLVEQGTFILDDVIVREDGKFDKDWHSIDLVRHRGHDGKEHYYSSKPPLLTVLLAGEYWLVTRATHAWLSEKPFFVGRLMLLLTNVPLFAVYLWLIAKLCEELGTTTVGRVFVFAAAAFGTAVTPFTVSLSNHLPAAVCCLGTLVVTRQIALGKSSSWLAYALAGFCAAMTVVGELPALSIFPFVAAILGWKSLPKTLVAAGTAGIVAAAALGTNYLAHGTLKPAYSQRKLGPVLFVADSSLAKEFDQPAVSPQFHEVLNAKTGRKFSAETKITAAAGRNILWDEATQQRLAIVPQSTSDTTTYEVREWGNWYDYETSYWIGERRGVDRGEESRLMYLVHILIGHHGLFSLTPIWLLAVWGGWLAFRSGDTAWRWQTLITACLFGICLAFYLSRPLIDRNYGGVSCTFRWLLWQVPLWIVLLLPAVDRLLANRWGWCFALTLLALSVFSAQYNATNPWSQPWIYTYWLELGWLEE